MRLAIAGLIFSIMIVPVAAQSGDNPYTGFTERQIKALSAQQIADLRAGRGMGLALAAELNGFPGPMHVLELADRLGLSAAQRERMEQLLTQMRADAVPLGERLIAQESALDRQFAERTIGRASLEESVAAIGVTQAALRHAHLKYHLATLDVLTPRQVSDYRSLRGYGAAQGHGGHHRKH